VGEGEGGVTGVNPWDLRVGIIKGIHESINFIFLELFKPLGYHLCTKHSDLSLSLSLFLRTFELSLVHNTSISLSLSLSLTLSLSLCLSRSPLEPLCYYAV